MPLGLDNSTILMGLGVLGIAHGYFHQKPLVGVKPKYLTYGSVAALLAGGYMKIKGTNSFGDILGGGGGEPIPVAPPLPPAQGTMLPGRHRRFMHPRHLTEAKY